MKVIIAGMLLISGPVLAAAPGAAPRWTAAGTGAGGVPIEIVRSSLTWRSMQRVRWRIRYNPPKPDGTAEERSLELIDCDARTSAPIETVSLDGVGSTLSNQHDGEDLAMQRMSPPTPGTTGERVAIQACRMRPPPPPPNRR